MNKELKFIHITKTGGTSIEELGLKHDIKWGKYHKEYGWWHSFFPLHNENFKKSYDWFTIVRNPYARIVSEFYCPYAQKSIDQNTSDVELFNKIIVDNIYKRLDLWQGQIGHPNNTSALRHGAGHWCEQYKYIDENVAHILKFENLQSEFNNLMKMYNINICLDHHENKSSKIFNETHLSQKTIWLINDIYHKDFVLFDYDKIQ